MSEPLDLPTSSGKALDNSLIKKEIGHSRILNAESLIIIKDVMMLNITSNGHVNAQVDFLTLHIVRFKNEPQTPGTNTSDADEIPTFLHVGEWVYPLIPGTSQVLHSTIGAYIFPDVMSKKPESFVALMFPESLSHDILKKFDDIIRSFAMLLEQQTASVISFNSSERSTRTGESPKQKGTNRHASYIVSKEIIGTATSIAGMLESVAERLEKVIRRESKMLKEKPKQLKEESSKIDPSLLQGIVYAQEITDSRVKVSSAVVNILRELTVALAEIVASDIKHSSKYRKSENYQATSSVDVRVLKVESGSIDANMLEDENSLEEFHTFKTALYAAANALERYLAHEMI